MRVFQVQNTFTFIDAVTLSTWQITDTRSMLCASFYSCVFSRYDEYTYGYRRYMSSSPKIFQNHCKADAKTAECKSKGEGCKSLKNFWITMLQKETNFWCIYSYVINHWYITTPRSQKGQVWNSIQKMKQLL